MLTASELLLHVPTAGILLNVVVPSLHNEDDPVIAPGKGNTVTTVVTVLPPTV
jgi:hypothetical protein